MLPTPLMKKGFGCFELETGAAIVGWISAIGNLLIIIGSIVQLFHSDIATEHAIATKIYFIINLCFSIMLIRGAVMRNRPFIVPYLIGTIIFFIVPIYLAVAIKETAVTIIMIIIEIIAGYFWACVFSLYQALEPKTDDTVRGNLK